jgi:acetylornithine/N-succinyldiaminopimelate aminotransferase
MTTLSLPVLDQAPAPAAAGAASAILGTYKRAPLEIVGGRGVELLGADGRAYLDFSSGIGVNALGYGDAGIRAAIAAAADTGVLHSSNLYSTEPGELLARRLVDESFASSVFFCNSGAEANEGAFKFARRWARSVGGPRKHEIVALRGGFHGRLFASLAATDRPAYRAPFRPLAPGISISERDLEDLAHILDADTVAAVIVEPVQGEGGVRVLDPALLRGLRQLTREREIALIFDEVQCGLGRTGTLFAYEQSGVVPDMLTLAKPLAGGLPMGAVLLSDEIARTIQPGDHATTFGGGPFVASVALHVLDRLADESLLAGVADNGRWLGERLGAMAAATPRIRAVRGVGYMWGVDVVESAAGVVGRALDAGLLILSAGDYTLRLLPPLVASRKDLEAGLDILEGVIA